MPYAEARIRTSLPQLETRAKLLRVPIKHDATTTAPMELAMFLHLSSSDRGLGIIV